MSTPDAAAPQPQQDPARPVAAPEAAASAADGAVADAVADGAVANDAAAGAAAEEVAAPVVVEESREVTLQRSVRYGRVLVGAAVLGGLIAMLLALVFPVAEKADYTLGQAVGFMAVIGAAIGLCVGGLFSLVLGIIAKRTRGSGVAIQSDVR
ncbi:hypothetical protein [Leucobacter sp. PH1c]|uniref:hypothetical protein n=1 Tax=Leucobacter sp. PH1c TaxID=1397278 RepID=UPI00046934CF|nr:hypothetical protein [Leucobacter sp. PH1c]